MDFITEIGLAPCSLVGGHGWMIKTLNAVEAQEVFKGMTMCMVHGRPGDHHNAKLSGFAFTADHPSIFEPLMTAGSESKGSVHIYADSGCSTDGNTQMQWPQLRQLSKCRKTLVHLAQGDGCKRHYEQPEVRAQGRTVYGGPGKHHRKVLLLNPFKLSGSTNWTVSSLGNQEESHFLWMNQAGTDSVGYLEAATLERSKPLARAEVNFRFVDSEGHRSPYQLKKGLTLARPAAG